MAVNEVLSNEVLNNEVKPFRRENNGKNCIVIYRDFEKHSIQEEDEYLIFDDDATKYSKILNLPVIERYGHFCLVFKRTHLYNYLSILFKHNIQIGIINNPFKKD